MAAQGSTTAGRLRRRPGVGIGLARAGVVVAALVAVALGVGFAFAGSADTLAPGTKIAGVDVGGLTPARARAVLQRRSASLANVPVSFVSDGRQWQLKPSELGVIDDWAAAVAAAHRKGDGVGFLRGFRRLELRLFPASYTAPVRSYGAAIDYEVGRLAKAIDRPARDARLVKHGLRIELVPDQPGTVLDRAATGRVLVQGLASLDRKPVRLPVRTDPPRVTAADLRAAKLLDERVLSAPVEVVIGTERRQLSRWQLAAMLRLQTGSRSRLGLGGPTADAFFARLDRAVSHPARDATFAVNGQTVRIVPGAEGLALDALRATAAVLAAARRQEGRVAHLSLIVAQPSRSTADAKAMGITGLVSSYETVYGGVPNRIHNVEVVAHLIDGKLIAPGATFSFNAATGARTAAKGFLEAPVIINGELSTGLGGGVCQVSTTTFNAAYEAGLPITARTNHALYISHYPLGRDATVDYPDVDLRFVNDTKHWLLLRTFVGSSSLVVSLYGAPQHRRVVTDTAPLRVVSPPPLKRTLDKSLDPGQVVLDDAGVPAQSTSVRRQVYAPNGTLLYDSTWYSNYRAEPKLVRFGPKKPKPAPAVTAPGKVLP